MEYSLRMSRSVLANRLNEASKGKTNACPKCKYLNDDDANYCNVCGVKLVELTDEEEASIKESWNEIKNGKYEKYDDIDTYTQSLKD